MEQTLVLNATMEPLKVVSWQRAITLWVQGKVEIVKSHDREVRSVTFTMQLPSVVRLLRFVKPRVRHDYVPFSRANIFARDRFTCQYCRHRFDSEDLTFDHVTPESRGGRKDWTNIVSCCIPCNKRKGARTPEEAGLTLLRKPVKPKPSAALRVTVGLKHTPEGWLDFLYWNAELET